MAPGFRGCPTVDSVLIPGPKTSEVDCQVPFCVLAGTLAPHLRRSTLRHSYPGLTAGPIEFRPFGPHEHSLGPRAPASRLMPHTFCKKRGEQNAGILDLDINLDLDLDVDVIKGAPLVISSLVGRHKAQKQNEPRRPQRARRYLLSSCRVAVSSASLRSSGLRGSSFQRLWGTACAFAVSAYLQTD